MKVILMGTVFLFAVMAGAAPAQQSPKPQEIDWDDDTAVAGEMRSCFKLLNDIKEGSQGAERAPEANAKLKEILVGLYPQRDWHRECITALIERLDQLSKDHNDNIYSAHVIAVETALARITGYDWSSLRSHPLKKRVAAMQKWWKEWRERKRTERIVRLMKSPVTKWREDGLRQFVMLTGKSFGYDPHAQEDQRKKSLDEIEEFLKKNGESLKWSSSRHAYVPAKELQPIEQDLPRHLSGPGNIFHYARSLAREGDGAFEKFLTVEKAKGASGHAAFLVALHILDPTLRGRSASTPDDVAEMVAKTPALLPTAIRHLMEWIDDRRIEENVGSGGGRPAFARAFGLHQAPVMKIVNHNDLVPLWSGMIAEADPWTRRCLSDIAAAATLKLFHGGSPVPGQGDPMAASVADALLKGVEALLADPDAETRWSAVLALRGIGGDRAEKDLIRMVQDKDEEVARTSAGALGALKSIQALETLGAALADREKHLWVREVAAESIGAIGSPKGFPLLLDAVKALREEAKAANRNSEHVCRTLGYKIAVAIKKIAEKDDGVLKEMRKLIEEDDVLLKKEYFR